MVLPTGDRDALIRAMDGNAMDYLRAYASGPGAVLIEDGEAIGYVTRIPHPAFNGAFIGGSRTASLPALHAALAPHLARHGRGGLWWLGSGPQAAGAEAALAMLGLAPAGSSAGMAMAYDPAVLDYRIAGLEIAEAFGRDGRRTWGALAAHGFGLSGYDATMMAEAEAALAGTAPAGHLRLIGSLNGTPVATASRLLSFGVSGIYAIATLPQAQRRGIGAAMTLAAMAWGLPPGPRVATLQASGMGRPLYARLGYETLLEYRLYTQP